MIFIYRDLRFKIKKNTRQNAQVQEVLFYPERIVEFRFFKTGLTGLTGSEILMQLIQPISVVPTWFGEKLTNRRSTTGFQ